MSARVERPELLTRLFSFADLCDGNPPDLKHATYRALEYKTGTVLNCGCERGYRRLSNFMHCAGNASHASWENRCQCRSTCKCFLCDTEGERRTLGSFSFCSLSPTDETGQPTLHDNSPQWVLENNSLDQRLRSASRFQGLL